jgi:hypothetical protein
MTRPTYKPVGSNLQSWDTAVDDNQKSIFGGVSQNLPMPLPRILDPDPLPAAAAWEQCIIAWEDGAGNWKVMFSDGTTWAQLVT